MKRSQITLIATGAACLVLLAGAAWFLFTALAAAGAAKQERDKVFADLKKIYGGKVFPNEANAEQVSRDFESISAWTDAIREKLVASNLNPPSAQPSQFFMYLQNTTRELALLSPVPNQPAVPAGFMFGFDYYLASSIMPDPEDMPRLVRQFAVIETLSRSILKADILMLTQFSRENFKEQNFGYGSAPANANTSATGVGKERFTIRFTARQNGLAEVQNILAEAPFFVEVASVSASKQNREDVIPPAAEQLALVKPKDFVAKPGESKFPPDIMRVVAGPDILPLLDITIEFDVLTFNPRQP